MSLQQVKIACLQYDHTMPLFEGAVKIEGRGPPLPLTPTTVCRCHSGGLHLIRSIARSRATSRLRVTNPSSMSA